MKLQIGFTGSRTKPTDMQREWLGMILARFDIARVHHGDCVGGDELMHELCTDLGIPVLIHPPISPRFRAFCDGPALPPKGYLVRNRHIVDSTSMLIGLPDGPERLRSGTWSTIRYARKLRRDNIVIWEHGR